MRTADRPDATVPLVSGAAVVIAFAFSWLIPEGAVLRPVGAVVPSLLLLGGYIVTANGLCSRPGLLGENRVAKIALVAAGIAGVLACLPGLVPLPGLPSAVYSTADTEDFTPVVVVATAVNVVTVVLLVVTALSIQRSRNAHRSTRTGLQILVVASLALTATPLILLALSTDGELVPTILSWVGQAYLFVGVIAGLSIAAPWLEPSTRKAIAGLRRGYRLYVDSTP